MGSFCLNGQSSVVFFYNMFGFDIGGYYVIYFVFDDCYVKIFIGVKIIKLKVNKCDSFQREGVIIVSVFFFKYECSWFDGLV